MTTVMHVRRRRDGTITVQGGGEDGRHSFSARWVQQNIDAGIATVTLKIGDQEFTVEGFDVDPNSDTVALTSWKVAPAGAAPKSRRRKTDDATGEADN